MKPLCGAKVRYCIMIKTSLAEQPHNAFDELSSVGLMNGVSRLHDHLLYRLCAISARLRMVAVRDILDDHDLDMRDWLTLAALSEIGAGSQREIAGHTKLDKVAVNRAAARLKQRELVTTQPNARDGRSHLLSLSEVGRETLALCNSALGTMESVILNDFNDNENLALGHLLTQLETAAESLHEA